MPRYDSRLPTVATKKQDVTPIEGDRTSSAMILVTQETIVEKSFVMSL